MYQVFDEPGSTPYVVVKVPGREFQRLSETGFSRSSPGMSIGKFRFRLGEARTSEMIYIPTQQLLEA